MTRVLRLLAIGLALLCAAASTAGAAMVNSPQLGPDGNLWAAWKSLAGDREGPAVDGLARIDRAGQRTYLHSGPYGSGFQISPRALAPRDGSSMWMVGERRGWDPGDGLYTRYELWILDTVTAAAKPNGSTLDATVLTPVLSSPPDDPELLYVNPIVATGGVLWGVGSPWAACEEPPRGRLVRIDTVARTAAQAAWPAGDDGRPFAFERVSLAADGRGRLWTSLLWPEAVRCPAFGWETSRWDRSAGVLGGDGRLLSLHHDAGEAEVDRCSTWQPVTVAHDGAVWCVANGGVLRFGDDLGAPDGFRLGAFGGSPQAMTAGPGGSVWMVLALDGRYDLIRLAPDGQTFTAPAALGDYLRGLSITQFASLTGEQPIVGTADGGLFLTAGLDGRWESRYDLAIRFVTPGDVIATEVPGPQLPRVSAAELATTPTWTPPAGGGSAPASGGSGPGPSRGAGAVVEATEPAKADAGPRLRATVRMQERLTRRQLLRQRGPRLRVVTNLPATVVATVAISPRAQRQLGIAPPRWSATARWRTTVRAGAAALVVTLPPALLRQVRTRGRGFSLPVQTRVVAGEQFLLRRHAVKVAGR